MRDVLRVFSSGASAAFHLARRAAAEDWHEQGPLPLLSPPLLLVCVRDRVVFLPLLGSPARPARPPEWAPERASGRSPRTDPRHPQ